ncbi:conserved hypothetical protein [Sporisorium reilianum SRZ2]|uniref:Uncharacterized protein n=1 Tax=Sporisorium reilianum (strain SRZ2) TaxID=999809 RepID=E6ZZV0_SPORE|nr:conserved hypothetical protein [Sporisorium reilianum SRZ2]
MTDTPASTSSLIALTTDAAQILLMLAPAVLLSSVIRAPRTALYIRSETLIMLTLVYALRYSHIFYTLPTLDNLPQYTHLLMLVLASYSLHWYQAKACLLQPASDAQDEHEVEKLLDPLPAALDVKRSTADVCMFRFDRTIFMRILFWSCLPALYSGEHSPLGRALSAWHHKPVAPFWQDAYMQLCIAATLLEINAMVLLFARVMLQRRAQINAPPPTEAQLTAACVGVDEWKRRMHTPAGVWAFIWLTVASAALALPAMVKHAAEAKRDTDAELVMWRLVGNGMLLVMFAVTMLFYRFMRASSIQLPKDEQEHEQASTLA